METAAAAANVNEEEVDEYEMASSAVDLMPPGFRFHPTDWEVIDYLLNKVIDRCFRAVAIGDIDLNNCEPWDLPKKAKMKGEKEWFFYFEKIAKYPSGMRTNRATPSGYWKATGKDKKIYKSNNKVVGMKKTLVFYKGRAPKGEKMNWVIHEYRLHGDFSAYNLSSHAKEKWVVCRVFEKKITDPRAVQLCRIDSFVDRCLLDSPTPLTVTDDDYIYDDIHKPQQAAAAADLDDDQFKPTTSSSKNLDQNCLLFHPNQYSMNPNLANYQQHENSRILADDIYIGGKLECKMEMVPELDCNKLEMMSTSINECDVVDEEISLSFSPNVSFWSC